MLFFFNDTATTEIYTLSLHDALPICAGTEAGSGACYVKFGVIRPGQNAGRNFERLLDACEALAAAEGMQVLIAGRSEEHTSELQSRQYLVCRLLLEKKNTVVVDRTEV